MSYNPDPVFRDGLNGYRKSAPPSAWERIESGLDRKKQKSIWLKIAAGLIVVIATSLMFWQNNQTDTTVASNSLESSSTSMKIDTIASFGKEESEGPARESSDASAERSRSMRREKLASNDLKHSQSVFIVERSRNNYPDVVPKDLPVVERISDERSRSSRNEHVENLRSTNTPDQNSNVALNPSEEKNTVPIAEASVEKTNEFPGNETVVEAKRTSITYTADHVNAKFTKPNVVPEATPAKKNASGLKTVIDKAVELTNDGAVFSEIREKKNEWLSFNNLSNKTEPNK